MNIKVNLFCTIAGILFIMNIGKSVAQINITVKEKEIKTVLKQIESESGYTFFYSDNFLDLDKKVSINVKNESVENILNSLFKDTDITFKIKHKQIALTRKDIIGKTKEDSKASTSVAQKQKGASIKGQVLDTKGIPIIGANIIEIGTSSNGTITDIDGNFSLNVAKNATIRVSYIGYLDQEISTVGKTSFEILLKEDTRALDEVVVVGYGTQRKSDLTGAVANISTDKLNIQSNSNIAQALQGRIAGVDIVSQGGRPGTGTRIMVRGIGTLNNSTPLYIVDGMYMSSIDDINPNDIKSIDVLKDASAAAIYGSRAANGVVIVTTKSGFNSDGKPLVEVSLSASVQTPEKYLDMLNAQQWADITTKARATINKPAPELAKELKTRPDNNWQRLLIKSAIMQNYNVSVRGGSQYFQYTAGLGYLKQGGMVKNTDFDRYNGQFKAEYNRSIFTFGSNIILSSQKRKPLDECGRTNLLGVILQSVPTLKGHDDTNPQGGYGKVIGDLVDIPNPIGLLDNELFDYTNRRYQLFLNLYAEAKLPYGFKYRVNYTPDVSWRRNFAYQSVFNFGLTKNMEPSASDKQYFRNNSLIENLLTFDKTFGKSKVSVLLGYSFHQFKNRYILASGKDLPLGVKEVTAATQYRLNDTEYQKSAMTSIISRIFYSYDNRYMVTATLRRDGSSKFPKDNRYGYFPSISLGWNVKEETFMQDVSWLDQFKIRGGYGVLGNQEIPNYLYQSLITTNINYPDGEGGILMGAFPKIFSSPTIKWEETAMTNIGFDIMALNQRLGITLDFFNKDTKDILLEVPIPLSTGGSNDPIRNAGKVNNKGAEFTVSWNEYLNKDFSYGITFTGSAVKNEMVQMGTENGVINGGQFRTGATTTRTLKGYPIGGFWLIKTDGLFRSDAEIYDYCYRDAKGQPILQLNEKTKEMERILIQPSARPGDIRFVDFDGDGKIGAGDKQYAGSPFPTFTTGLNFNARYRAFDAMVGLQGVFGNKIYNGTRLELEGVDKGTNYLATVLDHWTPENPDGKFPRINYSDPNLNNRPESDRFLEDGSFVRLRSIQLGYTLPNSLFNQTISKARISLSAENLLTFTQYTGYTPDINAGNATSRGFDLFNYPSARSFTLGVQVNF